MTGWTIEGLCRELLGHRQTPSELLGPQKMHPKEWGESSGLHPKVFIEKNKLFDATDADVVSFFTNGMTNEALVHELGLGN